MSQLINLLMSQLIYIYFFLISDLYTYTFILRNFPQHYYLKCIVLQTVIERVKERFMQRHLSSSEDDSKTTTSSVQSLNRNKSISRSKNKSTMETNKSGSYCQSSESESKPDI